MALALLLLPWASTAGAQWRFTDVTVEAGVAYEHGYFPGAEDSQEARLAGGVAAGDYDRDGWTDLYVIRGEIGPNVLLHNRGDGTFEDTAATAGVALDVGRGSGPLFADLDGDGWTDLLVGGVNGAPTLVFRNGRDGTFTDITAASGIAIPTVRDTIGATAADWDRDGDLDLFLAHWFSAYWNSEDSSLHLWRNDDGVFTDITLAAGLVPAHPSDNFNSFAASFVDIDGDDWPDMLAAADFYTSRIFRNLGGSAFADVTDRNVITDGNGMGSAVGDYDEDGDFDWFVTSIWDPDGAASQGNWDTTGNRLYRNRGDGTFDDATEQSGVRRGYWGWATTFQDFDNDRHLDLYHVNGYRTSLPATVWFNDDPARLFVGNGAGTFTERSTELGVADTGNGRGLVAFDYDRDGDLDIFIANNGESCRLYRNDGLAANNSITVRLRQRDHNTDAIGAEVDALVEGRIQRRLMQAGSNYVSQDPAEIHFGLGGAAQVERLDVRWPNGTATSVGPIAAGARVVITRPEPSEPACDASAPLNPCSPGGYRSGECLLEWKLAAALTDRHKLPSTMVLCQEGDPSCDLDPDVNNGECHLSVTVCLDTRDPRVGICEPGAAAARLEQPSATASDAVDQFNRTQLLNAIDELGLPPLTDTPPLFRNAGPNLCSAPVTLRVPVGAGPIKPRRGLRHVVLRVGASDGRVDSDHLRLMCSPSPVRRTKVPRR